MKDRTRRMVKLFDRDDIILAERSITEIYSLVKASAVDNPNDDSNTAWHYSYLELEQALQLNIRSIPELPFWTPWTHKEFKWILKEREETRKWNEMFTAKYLEDNLGIRRIRDLRIALEEIEHLETDENNKKKDPPQAAIPEPSSGGL